MAKTKRESFITVPCIAVYPKISKPDTYGPKADGKYKTNMKFTDVELEAYEKKLKAFAKVHLPLVDPKNLKLPIHTDKKTGERTLRASSKYKPAIFDSKNNKIGDDVLIGGGTKMRCSLGINPYDDRISLYLNQVQVLELVVYEPKGAGSAFDAQDDGFTYEGNADSEETGDTSKGEDSSDF